MRPLLAVGILLLAASSSGCLDALDAMDDATSGPQCPDRTAGRVDAFARVVFWGDAPDDLKDTDEARPRISLDVGKGQIVLATAFHSAMAGDVEVAYDGPKDHVDRADSPSAHAWGAQGVAERAGNYTLELWGMPLAEGVTYTLVLHAVGCPLA